MSRTIVQKYGPIYGEPVNGTVQGRPNGSVYVPSTNTVSISMTAPYIRYNPNEPGKMIPCQSDGTIDYDTYLSAAARSQDLSSFIQIQVYSDSALTTRVAYRNWTAGQFNFDTWGLIEEDDSLTDGQTLYVRAQLINGGVAVATSDTLTVTMVVPA